MTDAQLVSVVYVSSAAIPFSQEALKALLRDSRRRNADAGVTRMLLYRSGNFIQAIEGPGPAIDALLDRIRRDPRHRDMIPVLRRPIDRREFGAWSMGYENLEDRAIEDDPGFTDFLRRLDRGALDSGDGGVALRLLDRFKQTNR